MARGDDELSSAIRDALATLTEETGRDAEALFGERVFEPDQLSPTGAHAMGLLEGAAIALGGTVLEMLDLAPLFVSSPSALLVALEENDRSQRSND